MKLSPKIVLILIGLLCGPVLASGYKQEKVTKWYDRRGNTHFATETDKLRCCTCSKVAQYKFDAVKKQFILTLHSGKKKTVGLNNGFVSSDPSHWFCEGKSDDEGGMIPCAILALTG